MTFEDYSRCTKRLQAKIKKHTAEDFIVVTHSLGSVLLRAVLPELVHKPAACFLLAPPTQACVAAKRLAPYGWYRLLTGEIGQLLANQEFMTTLPLPGMTTKIYSGDAGFTGEYSPFKNEANDGVLMVKETQLPGVAVQIVPSLHTFIMNNSVIANDVIAIVKTMLST